MKLTESEARIKLNKASELLCDARAELSRRLESLRNHEANLRAGMVQDDLVYFQHSVDVMQEVCQRLMIRIERLELQAGIYDDEPDFDEFRVKPVQYS